MIGRRVLVGIAALGATAGVARIPMATGAARATTWSARVAPRGPVVAASVSTRAFNPGRCATAFVPHVLPHATRARGADVLPFDTNGAGLAVGDLNGDGRIDIVLGDLRGSTSVLWNRGDFRFERAPLSDTDGSIDETETRSVAIVDVDGDGRLDIATTHTRGGISIWHNNGDASFASTTIDHLIAPAYVALWDDIDGDGDIDLVTASYDANLERELGNSFLLAANGGVVVYENVEGVMRQNRLTRASQSLAATLFDVNADGRRDLVIGNDFGVPDAVFVRLRGATLRWTAATPFRHTARNTMGFAVSDFDNDGRLDLFSTDMKPSYANPAEIASWMPLLQRFFERLQPSDSQRPENALQHQRAPGSFSNVAYKKGIDATGWSWSAQFGDLDDDGNEDLYIVNGMIDHELLHHLRGDELQEANIVFRGDGGRFHRQPSWGLGSTASGRAMALVDLNGDGRLDAVVNNLGSAAVVYENRLCGGHRVELDLVWPGKQNSSAFGSTVIAHVDGGDRLHVVMPEGGYLTGLTGRVHIGVPAGKVVRSIDVIWPDGARTTISRPALDSLTTVRRG